MKRTSRGQERLLAIIMRDLISLTRHEVEGSLTADEAERLPILRESAVKLIKKMGYDRQKREHYSELILCGLVALVPRRVLRRYPQAEGELNKPTSQRAKYFLDQMTKKTSGQSRKNQLSVSTMSSKQTKLTTRELKALERDFAWDPGLLERIRRTRERPVSLLPTGFINRCLTCSAFRNYCSC